MKNYNSYMNVLVFYMDATFAREVTFSVFRGLLLLGSRWLSSVLLKLDKVDSKTQTTSFLIRLIRLKQCSCSSTECWLLLHLPISGGVFLNTE